MMKLVLRKAKEETKTKLCAAIKAKRVVEFYYHGGFRTAEPFCLGVTMTGVADNESLLCFQTGGYSEYGEEQGWKLYRTSEMTDLAISREGFTGDRPGYEPANPEMAIIYCCISMEGVKKPPPEPARPLTHNELMRRFRFTHPHPLEELVTLAAV